MQPIRRLPKRRALACALLGLAACGDDVPTPTPAPETAPEATVRSAAPAPTNAVPRIESMRFEPDEPAAGDTVRVLVDATDDDGDSLSLRYAWKLAGARIQSDSPQLALAGASRGDRLEVVVVASDGKAESRAVTEAVDLRNAPPRIVSAAIEPTSEVVAGQEIVARPEAHDGDGDAITFRYEWSVNDYRVDERGPVLSTAHLRRGDTVALVIVPSDDEDDGEPLVVPPIPVANGAPRIVSKPGEPSADGAFRYQVAAEDPDGDRRLQFSLEDAPAGMEIDAQSGEVVWVPQPDQVGRYRVSVVADDRQGGVGRQLFEVTVNAPPDEEAPASPAP